MKKIVGEAALDLIKNENIQNKTINFLEMLFPYIGIEKKAVDTYIEEIEKSNLPIDVKIPLLLNAKKNLKKMKNQEAIAEIAKNNIREGTNLSKESGVSEEWLDRFMESASFVSLEQMQLVWGKILANEFENPGCIPSNMIRILSEFTPLYASVFKKLCSMRVLLISINDDNNSVMKINWRNVIAFSENEEYMKKIGISFEILNELETLGVIKFNPLTGYADTDIKENKVLVYLNGRVLETSAYSKGRFPIGNVIFTSAGEALRKITDLCTVKGYEETVIKYIREQGIKLEESQCKISIMENKIEVFKEGER